MDENARLKAEIKELQNRQKQERADAEAKLAKERNVGKSFGEQVKAKQEEMELMKNRMVRLTRQLDEEVMKRDHILQESQTLERKLYEIEAGSTATASPPNTRGGARTSTSLERTGGADKREEDTAASEKGVQVSTKLMRVVDQWMRTKDLQQALLRGAGINDESFSTLVQVLNDCPSLATLDLSQNMLTMDSCSDICLLITAAPSLSFISVAENLFSLRSIGYFMTAIMERQNTKKLMPIDLLDMQGNEGLVAAAAAPPPGALAKQMSQALGSKRLPQRGAEMLAQVLRALWRFLHDTNHPQVRSTSIDEVNMSCMDKVTLRKMENALMKILLMSQENADGAAAEGGTTGTTLTANLALTPQLEQMRAESSQAAAAAGSSSPTKKDKHEDRAARRPGSGSGGVHLPAIDGAEGNQPRRGMQGMRASSTPDLRDPFADLKTEFEPRKEKAKIFRLQRVVSKNGTVLMSVLERQLETTDIDARDVKTEQTLLEYACHTGNIGLAKFCSRRKAKLNMLTTKGETYFNIVTKNRRYDLMEFLHTYGVKVDQPDQEGKTALHVAAANNDVDAVCRLLEWGADVNLRDNRLRTPLHLAAAGGHKQVTMLLLEVGAEMNAKDAKEYTAVAHAENNNHFELMDRLVKLGGKGHGLTAGREGAGAATESMQSTNMLGKLSVTASMLKSSSLGRIGKVPARDIPAPYAPHMRPTY